MKCQELCFRLDCLILITHAKCCVTTRDDDEVEPIPRISQVGIFVDGKPLGNDLDEHLDGINRQEKELGFFNRFTHRKENTVEKNRSHNKVVEELISRDVHANSS